MNKRRQEARRSESSRISRKRIMTYGIIAALVSLVGYLGYQSMTPANGNNAVFGVPSNHFVKAKYSPSSGYAWVSMSSGSVKNLRNSGGGGSIMNPSYIFSHGQLQSFHVINEDNESHSMHNFNIDELNVHTRDLGYFGSQTITFVADKTGTYQYYCSIHPEMKGDVIIE